MSKYPAILTAAEVLSGAKNAAQIVDKYPGRTKYVPARPLPFYTLFGRWKAAWLVFTGRADALLWEGQ